MQTRALLVNVPITGRGRIYDWRLCSEGCLTDWYGTSAPYPSVSSNFLTVHSLVPYHPLPLDSRTPGICFGPYDDLLRTTCAEMSC
jgi:hypothetical protein